MAFGDRTCDDCGKAFDGDEHMIAKGKNGVRTYRCPHCDNVFRLRM